LVEEDWALEADLRGVERLMKSLKSRMPLEGPIARLDKAPHLPGDSRGAITQHGPLTSAPINRNDSAPPREDRIQPRSHTAAWCILSLGLAVFACGAVLLAWSLIARREDLWPVGMPLALIG